MPMDTEQDDLISDPEEPAMTSDEEDPEPQMSNMPYLPQHVRDRRLTPHEAYSQTHPTRGTARATLRPWEVSYWDNKELCEGANDQGLFGSPDPTSTNRSDPEKTVALVAVDYKTGYGAVRFGESKDLNGKHARDILVEEGVHKLPYTCTVRTDGCGSMKHIENMVPDLGIRHDPTPPKDPSLNRAEKFIDTIWRAARSMMIARNVPDKYFHYAISYAVYVHNRCANHQNDGSITPYEATRGVRPSIGHLKTFFSDCYIHVDKTERDKQKKRGLHHHRATPGYFLGFADNHSHSQYAVLDRYTMRLRHSRSVTFRTDLLSPPRNPNPANDTDKGIEVINEPLDIYDLIDHGNHTSFNSSNEDAGSEGAFAPPHDTAGTSPGTSSPERVPPSEPSPPGEAEVTPQAPPDLSDKWPPDQDPRGKGSHDDTLLSDDIAEEIVRTPLREIESRVPIENIDRRHQASVEGPPPVARKSEPSDWASTRTGHRSQRDHSPDIPVGQGPANVTPRPPKPERQPRGRPRKDGMPPGTTRTKNPVAKKPVTDDEWQAWYRTTDNFTIDIDPITEEQARGWPESYVDLGEDDAVMAEHGWDPHSIYWDRGSSPEWRTHNNAASAAVQRGTLRSGRQRRLPQDEEEDQIHRTNACFLQRARHPPEGVDPSRVLMTVLQRGPQAGLKEAELDREIEIALHRVCNATNPDYATLQEASRVMAVSAQHDMSWKKILESDDRQAAVDALEAEMKSLQETILTRVTPEDSDWGDALNLATTGRILLDKKRNGKWKGRAVKQGFKEDKLTADGAGFNYYSNVVRLSTIRAALFRPGRSNRRCAIKDVATAYLQAHKYDGFYKYVCFRNPVTGKWEYYRQSGPIYGEASAAKRWEDTIAPWLEEQGFIRGENERCVFHHPEKDLFVALYVDDVFADGEEADINWFFDKLDKRFKCKEAEWLTRSEPLDYLGMTVGINHDSIYISMHRYIQNMLDAYDLRQRKVRDTPISAEIATEGKDATPLDFKDKKRFMSILGSIGWLNLTARPDVAYAHSRIGQHMANPTKGALRAVLRVCDYLKGTSELALTASLNGLDETTIVDPETAKGWSFFSDSDHAGNAEVNNKRRSQNGYIFMLNGAPVQWTSKASSVAFAHPDIGEAHADMSSAAAEIYCAGNATCEILGLGYIIEESGMEFPKPAPLQLDNATAESFANNSTQRSKLKHIDCRQEWVRMLRDKNLIKPVHVDTKKNVADLFTKILPASTFQGLVNMIMRPIPLPYLELNLHKVGPEDGTAVGEGNNTNGNNSSTKKTGDKKTDKKQPSLGLRGTTIQREPLQSRLYKSNTGTSNRTALCATSRCDGTIHPKGKNPIRGVTVKSRMKALPVLIR